MLPGLLTTFRKKNTLREGEGYSWFHHFVQRPVLSQDSNDPKNSAGIRMLWETCQNRHFPIP